MTTIILSLRNSRRFKLVTSQKRQVFYRYNFRVRQHLIRRNSRRFKLLH